MCDCGIDWVRSREVYNYCYEHGIDTGRLIPTVSKLSGNILLGEKIIGRDCNGEIVIYKEDLSEAILLTIDPLSR